MTATTLLLATAIMQRPAAVTTRSNSLSMDDDGDVRAKHGRDVCGGSGETSSSSSAAAASRIILARWARRQQQACEQMVLTTLDLDRRDRESELIALARLHAVSMLDASFLRSAAAADHGDDEDEDRGREDGRRRGRSPERAFVRRIAREWTAASPHGGTRSGARRGGEEWLGETERERVRSVRERVRMASSQAAGDHRQAPRPRGQQHYLVTTRMAMERRRELQGISDHRAVSSFAHRGRIQSLLRGRFFGSGRLMNDERPVSMADTELGQLRQSHPVSRFREEFRFRTEGITSSDQATSGSLSDQNTSVSSEHDSLTPQVVSDGSHNAENAAHDSETQTHLSTEDDAFVHTENSQSDVNNALQDDFAQEQTHPYEEYSYSGSSSGQDSEQSGSAPSTASTNSMQQEAETYTDLQWSRDRPDHSESGHDDRAFLDRDEEWHVIDSQEAESQWQSGRVGLSSNRSANRFSPPDGDVYGVELRELLNRRSVSNLLRSGFRESLDQLIQSYAQRQEHDHTQEWDFEGQRPSSSAGLHNEEEHPTARSSIDEPVQAERDAAPQPSAMAALPDQTLFPQQQRQWPHHHNWSTQQAWQHRSEFDWDAVHVLRDELTGVQRGMTSMQQMLEACMEMQIELQRSIKQEVSAALNRSSATPDDEEMLENGAQWKLARKGTCCICCDSQIDALLYRCGHMCTCSKCASELLHGVGKCPLCRAPIVEVIRAYCIM